MSSISDREAHNEIVLPIVRESERPFKARDTLGGHPRYPEADGGGNSSIWCAAYPTTAIGHADQAGRCLPAVGPDLWRNSGPLASRAPRRTQDRYSLRSPLKKELLAAKSTGLFHRGRAARLFVELFRRANHRRDQARVTVVAAGLTVGALLARSEGMSASAGQRIGAHQRHRFSGRWPPESSCHRVINGLNSQAASPDARKALAKFFTSPESGTDHQKVGLETVLTSARLSRGPPKRTTAGRNPIANSD